jgi:hypothetical protein
MYKLYRNFGNTSYQNVPLSIPDNCPICGVINISTLSGSALLEYNDGHLAVILHRCNNPSCKKHFYTTHKLKIMRGQISSNFLAIYPRISSTTFEPLLTEMSPDFVKIYNGAYASESDGYIHNAGMGYRLALEFLLKDYLINVEELPREKIEKLSIADCIKEHFSESESFYNSADVVRILGNSYSHYVNRHPEIDFDTIKTYLDFCVALVLMRIKMKKPPVSRQVQSKAPDASS